jgi:hypothetical protein
VRLHIERVVVDGLPGMRAADLEGAVVAELTRLLLDGGLPPGLGDHRESPAGERGVAPAVRVAAGADAGTFGTDVARAVYRSLTGSATDGSRATVAGTGAPTSGPG